MAAFSHIGIFMTIEDDTVYLGKTCKNKRNKHGALEGNLRYKSNRNCVECHRIFMLNYQRQPESKKYQKAQKIKLKYEKYGFTSKEYETMKWIQNNRCAICLTKDDLVIDHCHKSGQLRALLCNKCNTGLGLFNDDIKRMLRAIEYLNKFKS